MRLFAVLALAGLATSAYYAPKVYEKRPGGLPDEHFVHADPLALGSWAEEKKALGAMLVGYGEAAEQPDATPEALMGRVRAGLVMGSLAMDQDGIAELIFNQAQAYIEHRARIDPDGSKLQSALREWVKGRVGHEYHQARMAANLYLAARGDDAAAQRMFEFVREGPFETIAFVYARRMHPAWRSIEPLAKHYLESGDLVAVSEAGAAVLEYHVLFRKGGDLLERFLPDIRAAFKKMRGKLGSFDQNEVEVARTALFGLAMLANLGYEEERAILARLHKRGEATYVAYPLFAEILRVAYTWAGLRPLGKDAPPSSGFDSMPPHLHEFYFRAACHRAAALIRQRGDERDEKLEKEIEFALQVVNTGCRSANAWVKHYCLVAVPCLDPEMGGKVVRDTLDGGGIASLVAACIADEVDDPVAVFLGGLSSPETDIAAISAISLLDMGNDLRCLERRE